MRASRYAAPVPNKLAAVMYLLGAFGVSAVAAWWGGALGWPAWAFALAAAAVVAVGLAAKPDLPSGVLIAAALAGLAAFLGARSSDALSRSLDATPVVTYDITQDPLPDTATGYVEIRGHLNMDTHLDEYAVRADERPDQNAPADFELRLLLPTPELAVPGDTRFVVARVPKTKPARRDQGVDVVRGELKPMGLELAAPLFGGQLPAHEIRGVLLDAAAQEQHASSALFDLGLALLAAIMGLFALRGAWARRDPHGDDDGDAPAPAAT